MATHYDIFRLGTVESTQDEARGRMDGDASRVLVVADEQLSGRGRQGREWIQPDRGLFASVGFTTDWELTARTLIPLVAGVAMRHALGGLLDIEVNLKWPNDLILDNDKVGGLLVEMNGSMVVVGCGVNLWWDEPVAGAGALVPIDPGSDLPVALAEAWASRLLAILERGSEYWPRAEYERASVTIGREVWWDDGHGSAVGIGADGALIVDQDGSETALHSGEVHMQDRG